LNKKLQQATTTAVLSFVFVMNSIQAPARAAAPTLKVQLQTLIKKASATWPKIGSYRILDNDYGRSVPAEIYFYNDQLEYKDQVPGYGGAIDSQTQVFEPFYSYTPFPTKTAGSKLVLEKLKVKRIDWTRYTGGYSQNEPNGYVDSMQYKKFFTLPLDILTQASNKSKSISLNKQSKIWAISSFEDHFIFTNTPENEIKKVTKKCTTYVSFNTNGRIKSLTRSFVDGYSDWYVFDTINPNKPFVDHLYVIDRETGMLAVYP